MSTSCHTFFIRCWGFCPGFCVNKVGILLTELQHRALVTDLWSVEWTRGSEWAVVDSGTQGLYYIWFVKAEVF